MIRATDIDVHEAQAYRLACFNFLNREFGHLSQRYGCTVKFPWWNAASNPGRVFFLLSTVDDYEVRFLISN